VRANLQEIIEHVVAVAKLHAPPDQARIRQRVVVVAKVDLAADRAGG
jgi:hypothetical protein